VALLICTGLPAARAWNLRTRFLRTFTLLSMKLHQTGEDTYVCFISDYWHLQPWYIEQEMRAGTLHIYKLVFSCGYILRGVEEMMPTFGDV
jgi:hypothetical protein